MSLSINNYYQKYYNPYDLSSGGADTSRTASTSSGSNTAAGTDSVNFSDIAKLFFNFGSESSDSVEDYTGTSVQSIPLSLSYTDIGSTDDGQTQQSSGIPSMLQAMGGFPPPFALGLDSTADDDAAAADSSGSINGAQTGGLTSLEAGLTAEDIQSVLANLQSSLSLPGTGADTSPGTDSPLAAVQALLAKTNLITATSSELSSLFSNILKLGQSRS